MTGTSAQKEIDEAFGHSPLARATAAVEASAQFGEIDRSSAVSERSRTSLESNGAGEAAPADSRCTAGWSKRDISHKKPPGLRRTNLADCRRVFPPRRMESKSESHQDFHRPGRR
jgi:hypothetical protein